MLGVCGATSLLLVGAHIDDFHTREIQLQTVGQACEAVGVTQQDGRAYALLKRLYGSFHHGGVTTLGKHHALWVHGSGGMKCACEFCLLAQHLAQSFLVCLPIGDGRSCHAAFYGGFGYCSRHLCDEAWVDGFRYEIFRSEL